MLTVCADIRENIRRTWAAVVEDSPHLLTPSVAREVAARLNLTVCEVFAGL